MSAWPINPKILVSHLASTLGSPITLDEESYVESLDTLTATASGVLVSAPTMDVNILVRLLLSEAESGEPRIWALVFMFINKKRVAPNGLAFMTYEYGVPSDTWSFRGWEDDPYDEWMSLEQIP